MNKKIKFFLFTTGVVVATVYFTTLNVTMRGERMTKQIEREVDRKIKVASLIGASPDEVIAFLDREKIAHGEYYPVDPFDPSRNRTIGARLPWVARTWRLTEGPYGVTVRVDFYFDRSGYCERYVIDHIPQI